MKLSKYIFFGFLSLFVVLGIVGCVQPQKQVSSAITQQELDFKMEMSKLWEDHITWTRMVIIGIADELPDLGNSTKRLLGNYDDMENALKPYYGEEAAEKFGDLLKAHLVIAAELVSAAKKGDSKSADDAEQRWYKNAEDIVSFLSKANPNWKDEALREMLYGHLKLTKQEAVARLTKDYAADVEAYDKVHEQALSMANVLSDGIIKQFPQKFGK